MAQSTTQVPGTRANHELIVEPCGVLIRFFGEVSSQEIREIAERWHAGRDFDSMRYVLHDFEGCSGIKLNPDEVEHLAAIDWAASLSHRRRLTILLWPDRPDIRALAAAYRAARSSPWDMRVVASEKAARSWLADVGYSR